MQAVLQAIDGTSAPIEWLPLHSTLPFAAVQSCALIGSSNTLLRANLGKRIDSFDVVTRVNRLPDVESALDLGTRTDVLFTRCGNAPSFIFERHTIRNGRLAMQRPSLMVHTEANASMREHHALAMAACRNYVEAVKQSTARERAAAFCRRRAAEGPASRKVACPLAGPARSASCPFGSVLFRGVPDQRDKDKECTIQSLAARLGAANAVAGFPIGRQSDALYRAAAKLRAEGFGLRGGIAAEGSLPAGGGGGTVLRQLGALPTPSSGFHAFLTIAPLCRRISLFGFGGNSTWDGHTISPRHAIEEEHAQLRAVAKALRRLRPPRSVEIV